MASPVAFTDEEFERAAHEVNSPDLNNYEVLVESQGTTIYRHYIESTGLYEYKTCGVMADLDPETCAQVYVDTEYRKTWDKYALELDIIEGEDGVQGLYWCVDYPWPMSDRDYTFVRDMKVMEVSGVKTWVVLAKYRLFSQVKEKSGVIRVDEFQQSCAMQSDGKMGAKAFMYYYDNPKGMIPTWLINWAAKTGVPTFLDTMRKAVFGYEDFLKGLQVVDNESRLKNLYRLSI